jgi:hypothetical protein
MQLTDYFQKTSLGFDKFVITNTTLLDSTFENWGVNCMQVDGAGSLKFIPTRQKISRSLAKRYSLSSKIKFPYRFL